MPRVIQDFGWRPDLADHRDYVVEHETVVSLLQKLKVPTRKPSPLPTSLDWREFCGPVEDQQDLASSAAHACVALIQQLERRATGRLLQLSRVFADYSARRLLKQTDTSAIPLRAIFKSAVRCGIPPEQYWPHDNSQLGSEPDAFAYSFQRDFRGLSYVRLDTRQGTGEETLTRLKSFLAAGFSFAFGFPLSTGLSEGPEIPFPTAADAVFGGHAVTAVGYDDKLRVRSDKGAILVRNCWGAEWGDAGYGWLPYAYVRERLAMDFWTLLKPSWLKSGEFELPQ